MLSTSNINAIEGKFRRNKVEFKNTFLFKEMPMNIPNILGDNEICVIYYTNSINYSWFLTNQNLIIPSEINISLSSLKKIDFLNIKENPNEKLMNKELDLFTENYNFSIMVEEKSWPLIYN
ncbi:hypothetical protein, partial [Chryseobacterium sp. MYb328]|uniref:hypothetical protein n=1 Tax=Chryseobacterium sp. MYb328 TaxID=2745231 RepID=UPI00309E6109